MISLIGGIISLVCMILAYWLKKKEGESPHEKRVENFDKALADSDDVRLSELFNELHIKSGGDPGRPDDKQTP